jgi:hypothetical protein
VDAAPQLDRYTSTFPTLRAARPPDPQTGDSERYHTDGNRVPRTAGTQGDGMTLGALGQRFAQARARIPELARSPGNDGLLEPNAAGRSLRSSSSGATADRTDGRPASAPPDRQMNRLIAQARLHLRKGDWLRYRESRLDMASLQRRRGHLLEALALYLDVWYLDTNGPRDSEAGESVAMLGTEDPPFDPQRALSRSPARRPVRKLMHALDLQPRHVQTLFLDTAGPTHRTLDLPLSPTEAWQRIGPELLF